MNTQTIKCNHFFCLGPARAYSRRNASYKVTQVWDNGNESVTYVCNDDMVEMRKVLKPTDIVITL